MNWHKARNFICIFTCALALVVPTAKADQQPKDLASLSIPSAKRVDGYANQILIVCDLNDGNLPTRSIKFSAVEFFMLSHFFLARRTLGIQVDLV